VLYLPENNFPNLRVNHSVILPERLGNAYVCIPEYLEDGYSHSLFSNPLLNHRNTPKIILDETNTIQHAKCSRWKENFIKDKGIYEEFTNLKD
jgi:hypothetical protein